METKILKCGCAGQMSHTNGNGSCKGEGIKHPSCFIHSCCELVQMPNLEGRIAKCGFCKKGIGRNNECDDCRGKSKCECQKPSSVDLAFFKYQPDEEFDSYYCGCIGWD